MLFLYFDTAQSFYFQITIILVFSFVKIYNMHISDLEMYDLLKERMSDKEARELVAYIGDKVEDKFIEAINIFATKEDLLKLELKIVEQIGETNKSIEIMRGESNQKLEAFRGESNQRLEVFRGESNQKLEAFRGDLIAKIDQTKSDTLKWTFVYILTATIGIIGTILSVMKMGGWGN